ncbi:MAG: DUF4426 domain-containing protein [Pseudomonadales bacterium]|jgi:hypothetical protein
MRWRGFLIVFALLSFGAVTQAEQMQRLGPFQAHYAVVQSTFFDETVARRYEIVRGRDRAVVNVSILDADGKPVSATVEGSVTNLLGQVTPMAFKEIREGEAVYYLAQIKHTDRETLRFKVAITTPDGIERQLDFQQQMFWDGR